MHFNISFKRIFSRLIERIINLHGPVSFLMAVLLAPTVAYADYQPPKTLWWYNPDGAAVMPQGAFETVGAACQSAVANAGKGCWFTGKSRDSHPPTYLYPHAWFCEAKCQFIDYTATPPVTTTWIADGGAVVSQLLYCPAGYKQAGSVCVSNGPDPDKNKGQPDCCEGNPINPTVGNKLQKELDYAGTGLFPLVLTRTYNSFGSRPGNQMHLAAGSSTTEAVGSYFYLNLTGSSVWSTFQPSYVGQSSNSYIDGGWRHHYDRTILTRTTAQASIATATRPDSKPRTFKLANGVWVPDAGEEATKLVRLIDGNGVLTGWLFTNDQDETESYDASGKLQSIKNRAGLMQTLLYNALGQLDSVTDPAGRKLSLTYDALGRVATVIDPANGHYLYEYDAANNLAKVTYPDNRNRQYVYENTAFIHGLTGIIDENGVRYATWTYDAQGKADSSEHAGGADHVNLTYGANKTTATDVGGATRSYVTYLVNGVSKADAITETCGLNCSRSKSFTYDVNGNIESHIDYNGNKTTYAYDLTRNLEIRRTEAAGTTQARTTTTQWHPLYRQPTGIAAPNQRTTLAYDAKGNLLTKTRQASTDPSGAQGFSALLAGTADQWTYTYNSLGQLLIIDGPRTDVADKTTYGYDAQGNLVTITNAAGHVTTLSNYDAHGRVGKIVDPKGLTTTLSYAPRGWLTQRIVASATRSDTTQYAYDAAGQLTKVTLPDASSISYTYDTAHRLTVIADSLGNRIAYTLDAMGNRINEQVKDPGGALARQITRVYDVLNRLQQVTGGA